MATTVQHFNIAWSGFSCSCWIKPKKQPWMTFYLSHRKPRHKCFEMSSYLCTVEQEYSSTTKSPCLEQHSSHWNRKGFYATHPSPALRLFGSRIIPEEWAVVTCRTWQWEMQWSSSLIQGSACEGARHLLGQDRFGLFILDVILKRP